MIKNINRHYNYIAIGGGSGGISSVNRASKYGYKCAIIESKYIGGTCVNVGCVPKKIMWHASQISNTIKYYASGYGFNINTKQFNWQTLINNRNKYIYRIRKSYYSKLDNNKVDIIHGFASFVDNHTIKVNGEYITSDHILIATGGRPKKVFIPGAEYGINSDGFFSLNKIPNRVSIIGAGYIAIEIAGILNGLGVETHLFIRKNYPLRLFDIDIVKHLTKIMMKNGIIIHNNSLPESISKNQDQSLTLITSNNEKITTDILIWAVGREPATDNLNLSKIGIETDTKGYIKVDKYQNTSVSNIYAIGDNIGKVELTPVAIAAGRILSDRIFNNEIKKHLDYKLIPTVIFSNPPIGSIGLTEHEAIKKYGIKEIKVYQNYFNSIYSSITNYDQPCLMKLICLGQKEKIIGLHSIGFGIDEIFQGFAVAIKMGATKKDLNNTIAIHPTISEEIVTI